MESPEVPRVGVGCIVMREGHVLLVRSHRGRWSTPGGHLDWGETPAACAARETMEETGIGVSNLEFVALTNDVFPDTGKHYITIWMRGDPDGAEAVIGDADEIADIGWFDPAALPAPVFVYFENLLAGNCLPPAPSNMPFTPRARASPA